MSIVMKDGFVSIAGKDFTVFTREVKIKYSANILEDTCMGSDTKTKKAGLKDWTVDLTFAQSYGAAEVDATIWPLVGADAVPVIFRPKTTPKAADNPEYTGYALIKEYNPISGKVGDLLEAVISLDGSGTLDRAVA